MTTFTGVGSPGSVGPTSGGKLYAYNTLDGVTPVAVAPANPSRQSVTFHNPGTNDVIVFPQYKVNTGTNVSNAVTTSALGGGFRVYGNGGEKTFTGECQGEWLAIAVTGTGNPLTVMDSNI